MPHEDCTTYANKRRHLAARLISDGRNPGRVGLSLCKVNVIDQERADRHAMLLGQRPPKRISELRPCGTCTIRAAAEA